MEQCNSKKIIKALRSLPKTESILNNKKRVYVFNGIDAKNILTKQIDTNLIKPILDNLLRQEIIVKVKNTSNKSGIDSCKLMINYSFNEQESYIFTEDESQFGTVIMALLALIVCLSLVMFQLWPSRLKYYASYSFYPIISFIVFLVVLAIIRLVFFIITFLFYPPGIWIFPKFFADVGFFESFVPLWEYNGVDSKAKDE